MDGTMDKIIVLRNNPEMDDNLVECLRMLFPECEIDVLSRPARNMDDFSYKNEQDVS